MKKDLPFVYQFYWESIPDSMLGHTLAEFSWNGVEECVFSNILLKRILQEPGLWTKLRRVAFQNNIRYTEAHAPSGQAYDICCTDRARHAGLIADHKLAMAYAAEAGCRTYTIHIGAGESVCYNTPNGVLRPYGVAALEKLAPEAEKLGIIIAVENSYERSNTPDEVVYYIEQLDSPYVRCCFDSGHANILAVRPEGKNPDFYSDEMKRAWQNKVEEYPDALGRLAPYIVTCHLHDNSSYNDDHGLPGSGTIDWVQLMHSLRSLPNIISLQSENRLCNPVAIGKMVKVWRDTCAL